MNSDGLIVVDKPAGMTSHDVVARIRRLAKTRRVGHAGTLDPMATGVLIIGVNKATRLLTYVVGKDKSYSATIRLGQSTVTDDAEGDVTATFPVEGVSADAIRAALEAQRGPIMQVPSSVSAIKINGERAYKRVREGSEVSLPARPVTISALTVSDIRPSSDFIDIDVDVTCSSGTYIRAIARDLGTALGTGGHLTALRRTAVGAMTLAEASTLEQLEAVAPDVVSLPLSEAARQAFPHERTATEEEAKILGHGGRLKASGVEGPYPVFAPDGSVIAIVSEKDGQARAEIVLNPAA